MRRGHQADNQQPNMQIGLVQCDLSGVHTLLRALCNGLCAHAAALGCKVDAFSRTLGHVACCVANEANAALHALWPAQRHILSAALSACVHVHDTRAGWKSQHLWRQALWEQSKLPEHKSSCCGRSTFRTADMLAAMDQACCMLTTAKLAAPGVLWDGVGLHADDLAASRLDGTAVPRGLLVLLDGCLVDHCASACSSS